MYSNLWRRYSYILCRINIFKFDILYMRISIFANSLSLNIKTLRKISWQAISWVIHHGSLSCCICTFLNTWFLSFSFVTSCMVYIQHTGSFTGKPSYITHYPIHIITIQSEFQSEFSISIKYHSVFYWLIWANQIQGSFCYFSIGLYDYFMVF
jgi:hypothetical protein